MALEAVCHRCGAHMDVLPLCLRCSSVYAGILLGLLFEVWLLARGRRPRLLVPGAAAAGILVQGAVGLVRLLQLFPLPEPVAVGAGLVFGWAVAAFVATAVSYELGIRGGRAAAPLAAHGGLLLLLGVLTGASGGPSSRNPAGARG